MTGYQVFRRVDDAGLRQRVAESGLTPDPAVETRPPFSSFDPSRVRFLDDRAFVIGGDQVSRGELPPGIWEGIAWMAAHQQDSYLSTVPTLGDSTGAGVDWSVQFITTHTTTPSVWFASQPDSGYSVDNLAPGVPGNFLVDHDYYDGPSLAWDASQDSDFQFFRVYRGLSDNFEIGSEALVHETAETSWIDAGGDVDHFYKVTALDHAGNESDPAAPDEVTGSDPATLLDGRFEAGSHSATWRGESRSGDPVSSGLYFYRLSAPGFTQTRKMLLLQ